MLIIIESTSARVLSVHNMDRIVNKKLNNTWCKLHMLS